MNSKLSISICILYSNTSKKMTDNRKSWTFHEDQAILSIVSSVGIKNWPLVSQLMKDNFHLNHRSGKQCRERWHNHLNPELNKQPWSEKEEQLLFEGHRKHGNKWIQISKLFGGRTDNSIKNQFYSTIRRSMRRVCKILGNRNSTSKLRNIRPSVLSQIFQFSKRHPIKSTQTENIDVASCLLQFAKQKPKKRTDFDPTSKEDLQMLVRKLIMLNEEYVNFKKERKSDKTQKKTGKKQARKTRGVPDNKKEEWSETNSSISQVQHFERQHSTPISQLNINSVVLENIIHNQQQIDSVSSVLVEQFQQNVSIGEQLEMQKIDEKLLIKPMPIHSMFESRQNFNERQHQLFHQLERPSFQSIGHLEQDVDIW